LQNDFAARADWGVKTYAAANHAPVIKVTQQLMNVKAGATVQINATAADPDKDKVNIVFWQYIEAGNTNEKVLIDVKGNQARVQLPATAKTGDTFHIIVEGQDSGTPSLTRYQRVVLTIK
jgi:hypothetical protein